MSSKKALDLFRKYRSLKKYKKYSDEELHQLCQEQISNSDYDIYSKFKDVKDSKEAKLLLLQYLKQYDIETISDKEYLSELIYLKILQRRIREQIETYYDEDNKAVPTGLIYTLNQLSESVTKITNTLGLNKREENAYNVLEALKARFKKHRLENQASRTLSCSHCGKMLLLKMRTEAWESAKHPFFQDKILSNKALIKLYLQNQLSKEQVAEVLECSPDYIDWLLDRVWKLNPVYQEFLKSSEAAPSNNSVPAEDTVENNEVLQTEKTDNSAEPENNPNSNS